MKLKLLISIGGSLLAQDIPIQGVFLSRADKMLKDDSAVFKFVDSFYEYEFWRRVYRSFNYYGRQLFRLDLKPTEQPLWLYLGWMARNEQKAKLQS